MREINLIFPHQLFEDCPLSEKNHVYIIEEHLFFTQYKFHKQKLVFHRASMKYYESYLKEKGYFVTYIEATSGKNDIREFIDGLEKDINVIHYIDPVDNYLNYRLNQKAKKRDIATKVYDNPGFLNKTSDLSDYFRPEKKKFFQTKFYKNERKRLNILLDKEGNPEGGDWTYDVDNRKKYPKNKKPPKVETPNKDKVIDEALSYVEDNFKDNYGQIETFFYPVSHKKSKDWLEDFLNNRFKEFGPYEDAIVREENILNHSVLSPLINSGLITPDKVLSKALNFYKKGEIPINSVEGFVRQIIGWREFIRGIYISKGTFERTRNFWDFDNKLPKTFYRGETGIIPVDDAIQKFLSSGYAHHIERLMIIGNFMLLTETDPDEVYRWFMEMSIDGYDWVMVPNIYGMSQFADGGLMSTKPYLSGSNYIIKMSNYGKGDWSKVWDGLFWRFLNIYRELFAKMPRMNMLLSTLDKMDSEKRESHFNTAEKFLNRYYDK